LQFTLYNLLRKPGRSLAAVIAVVLAAGTAFAGALISVGVHHSVAVGMERLGADLMVVPQGTMTSTHTALVLGEPVAFYMDGSTVQKVAGVPGVRSASPQTYVETLSTAACCTGRMFLVGFDAKTDFTVQPWLRAVLGRDLRDDEILIGAHILQQVGSTMRFFGTEFKVAGVLDPTGMGMDETAFLPASSVAAMAENSTRLAEKPLTIPSGSVSAVMVRLANPAQAEGMARQIEAAVPGVSAMTAGQVTQGVNRDLSDLMAWLLPLAGGILLVAMLLFIMLFSAVTAERSREIGLLRAMGATQRQTVTALVGEAMLLGILGAALGVGAGAVVYMLFEKPLQIDYALPFLWPSIVQQVGLGLAVVAGSALIAGLAAALPAMRIARLEPHYAIHVRR
jgi:putative ABC transport system permease protein